MYALFTLITITLQSLSLHDLCLDRLKLNSQLVAVLSCLILFLLGVLHTCLQNLDLFVGLVSFRLCHVDALQGMLVGLCELHKPVTNLL